ncbi:MAG: EAL domain-containing protein [Magnetococcus sp. YQC-3]
MHRLRRTHLFSTLLLLGLTLAALLVVYLDREATLQQLFGTVLFPLLVAFGLVLRFFDRAARDHEDEDRLRKEELEHTHGKLENRLQERTRELTTTNLALYAEVGVRRHVEDELSLAANIYRSTREAIVVVDAHGIIRFVNEAFSDLSGYAMEEVTGQSWTILQSEQTSDSFCQSAWQEMLSQGRWQGEVWSRRKQGNDIPEYLHVSVIRDGQGQVQHYVAIAADLSELKQAKQQVEFLAHHDVLTGLPNRTLLLDRVHQAFAYAQRFEQLVAVMFLGLDRFKVTNELIGRKFGDQLLRDVADRLRFCVRSEDSVARIGGDEFVVLATGLLDVNNAAKVAAKVMQIFANPFIAGNEPCHLSASMGIAVYPFDQGDPSHYIKNAESAMVIAKGCGGGQYRFYTQEMGVTAEKRLSLEKGLQHALERDEFFLYYQPQIDVMTGRMVGVEALIRWRNKELGLVSPAQFIPLAEESNVIIGIGEWVLRTACSQAMAWRREGFAPVRMAVNLSARQFQHPGLLESVERALHDTGLEPQFLELEMTEGLFMGNLQGTISLLEAIERKGLLLSIDDFGTGYSSLSYLKKFPVHTLKIDQAFVRDITDDPDDAAITRTIIAMAKSLSLHVVAEGVASVEQLEYLRALGCDIVQGFLFSPPVAPEEITLFLEEDKTIRSDQERLAERGHVAKLFANEGRVIPFPGRQTATRQAANGQPHD